MSDTLLINVESKELRCAHLRGGRLHNLFIERKRDRQITGNIYKGRVTNILSNIQSAFVTIENRESGFIHISDAVKNSRKLQEMFDLEMQLDSNKSAVDEESSITDVLKENQWVMTQVVKEAIGSKGARLTCNISLPGRYLVLIPNSPHRGVSRKIESSATRENLRRLIKDLELPDDVGLICRTASKYADSDQIQDEATELLRQWYAIAEGFNKASEPTLLYEESDLIRRSLLSAVDQRMSRILVDDPEIYQVCKDLYSKYEKEHPIKIELYRDRVSMFERFGVEKEIDHCLSRKIWLNSGGYLYFDRTEAMYTIDVNSGRSSSTHASQSLEESLVRINLEAAEEIARQIRIRNIGGLIICDFIDMRSRKNQKRVLEKLRDCMRADTAKSSILGMSEFGLVEMTRQRSRESLAQILLSECPYCSGMGLIRNNESVTIDIERSLKKAITCMQHYALELVTHPHVDQHLGINDKSYLQRLAEDLNARLQFSTDDALHLNDFYFNSTLNQERLEV